MPRISDVHQWHKLPAPNNKTVLLLVANNKEPHIKWLVTGLWHEELKQFISALPTRKPIATEALVIKGWAPIVICSLKKRFNRHVLV